MNLKASNTVQLSLFDLAEDYKEIECPHCGARFNLSSLSAANFEQVHGCYVRRREGLTTAELIKKWYSKTK